MKKDYHDYVIRDGTFIGKFEEMYQNCDDPWHQTEAIEASYSRMCSIASLHRIGAKKVLEVGSGLGYYTNFLKQMCPDVDFFGVDISETAVRKSADMFKNIRFFCDNIKNIDKIVEKCGGGHFLDTLIFSEIMWYILDDLDDVLGKLRTVFKERYLLINQVFYYGEQRYGREFFTNQDEMIRRLGFECVYQMKEERKSGTSYETHTVLLVK